MTRGQGDDRRQGSTGPRRAVKVRPGRATDLLFNPAAEDYGQPLYPAGGDRAVQYPAAQYPAAQYPAAGAGGTVIGPPRQDRRPDDSFTSPQQRLNTAEYSQPLYSGPGQGPSALDSGPVTGARPRRAWPDDDPLGDTDARGRRVPGDGRPATGRTGPQRRISGGPRTGDLPAPGRADLTGPQRRVDGLAKPDPLTDSGIGVLWATDLDLDASAPPQAAMPASAPSLPVPPEMAIANAPATRTGTGPFDLPALDGQETRVHPLDEPDAAPGGKPAREPRTAGKRGGAKPGGSGKQKARAGRRRRGKRAVALVLGGLVILGALAAVGYDKLMPKTTHTVTTPAALGSYTRQQANATARALKHRILTAASGNVKNVVAAVYRQKGGKSPQIVVFIGGNLTGNASSSDLISAYMARLHNAFTTKPGSLGGQAVCAPGSDGGPAECAWADGDTFGVVVSATLSATGLAGEMRQMRPLVEHAIG